MKSFQTIKTTDYDLNKVIEDLKLVLNSITSSLFLNGTTIENLSLIAGQDNLISHNLGKQYRYWFLISGPNVQTQIWENANSFPEKFLNLRTSVNCTIKIFVG